MKDTELIDQSDLAVEIANKIKYEFSRMFLVKPLEIEKVKKEFSTPIAKDKSKKDKNGIEAADYDKVKTEIKEVESDYRKGVVIKVPQEYITMMQSKDYPTMPIKCGDIVVYKVNAGIYFDLVKDTQIISIHDIVAKVG